MLFAKVFPRKRIKRGKLVGSESARCSVSDPPDSEDDVDVEKFFFLFTLDCMGFVYISRVLHPPWSPTTEHLMEWIS